MASISRQERRIYNMENGQPQCLDDFADEIVKKITSEGYIRPKSFDGSIEKEDQNKAVSLEKREWKIRFREDFEKSYDRNPTPFECDLARKWYLIACADHGKSPIRNRHIVRTRTSAWLIEIHNRDFDAKQEEHDKNGQNIEISLDL